MAFNRNSAKYFLGRLAALKKERQSFIKHYKVLAEFIQPRRGRFLTSDRNVGGARHAKIVNSRGTQAHGIARSGMFAGVMSPSRPWFSLRVLDDPDLMEFQPVKVWLHDVELLMREVFSRGNLYNMAPVMLGELLLFGTGCMTHVDDFLHLARFYTHTAGSYLIGQNSRFQVDTLAREFEMTTGQMIEEFGEENVSQTVKTQYTNGDYDIWHPVAHFIEPNPDADPSKLGSRFKAFRSVKYEPGNIQSAGKEKGMFLSRRGFDRFPAYVPRWDLTGEDIYGTNCPAMVALGDIKGLQTEERRKAQGIDKMVNPPLKGPASLRNVPVASIPGGLTIYDMGTGTEKLEPIYKVVPQLQELTEDIRKVERRIDEAFYVDMFLAISTMEGIQPKNQLELAQRNEERLLQLGPVLERVHGEFLDGLIDRTFDQMVEADLLLPAPEELQGMSLKVEYISSLAMAQRAVATGSIDRFFAFIGSLREMGYEQALDKGDADQGIDDYAALIGVPPRLVVPDGAVEEVRREREAERQRQLEEDRRIVAMKTESAAARDVATASRDADLGVLQQVAASG